MTQRRDQNKLRSCDPLYFCMSVRSNDIKWSSHTTESQAAELPNFCLESDQCVSQKETITNMSTDRSMSPQLRSKQMIG